MSVIPPCSCGNFFRGRPYVAGRDCAKCWMFTHRPDVRKAWGGNPADCEELFSARQNISAQELADLLDGPPIHLPDDWRMWPVTREAHRILVDRFLAAMPPYPKNQFTGRGAVICGGGRYEAGIYVACKMLREVGWEHPIEVWHRGEREPVSHRVRGLPGVKVIDIESHPARRSRRIMGGWESKSFALIHSSFEEILYLDADSYPVGNPDDCFTPHNNPHGIVTWPDTPWGDESPQWGTYGVPPDGRLALNGGHYVFQKEKAWRVLQLAGHYDNHSDYYHCRTERCSEGVGGFGDQDQMRVAIHKLNARSHRYTSRPLACARGAYIQAGPSGQPLFVHRFMNKFALPGQFPSAPKWYPEFLPMEATAWRYFLEWVLMRSPLGSLPDEIPGWFTQAECELWSRFCEGRSVLELGRHQGRSTCVSALSAQKVVSIDRKSEQSADLWLQRYGVRHKVWLRRGDFAELVPTSGGPFSACLIDGVHDRLNVETDIATVIPHLTPGAVIGFHDYDDSAFPDVKSVVDHAAQRYGWRFIERTDHLAVFETSWIDSREMTSTSVWQRETSQ